MSVKTFMHRNPEELQYKQINVMSNNKKAQIHPTSFCCHTMFKVTPLILILLLIYMYSMSFYGYTFKLLNELDKCILSKNEM